MIVDYKNLYSLYLINEKDKYDFISTMFSIFKKKIKINAENKEQYLSDIFNENYKIVDIEYILNFKVATLIEILNKYPLLDIVNQCLNKFNNLDNDKKDKLISLMVKTDNKLTDNLLDYMYKREGEKYFAENEYILNKLIDDDKIIHYLTDYLDNNNLLLYRQTELFKEMIKSLKEKKLDIPNIKILRLFSQTDEIIKLDNGISRIFKIDLNQIDNYNKDYQKKYMAATKELLKDLNNAPEVFNKTYGYKNKILTLSFDMQQDDKLLAQKIDLYYKSVPEAEFSKNSNGYAKLWGNTKLYVQLTNEDFNKEVVEKKKKVFKL